MATGCPSRELGLPLQGHRQLLPGGRRAGGMLEVLALSHPGLSFPPVPLVPTRANTPAAAWVWHWVLLQAARGQLLTFQRSTCHRLLRQGVLNRSLSARPGSPKRPWATGEGWAGGVLGSRWALADLGLELELGSPVGMQGCFGDWGAAAAGLGRQSGSPCCWRGRRQGRGFGQLHGATVPAGKSLFGEENESDLPRGSSEGKGRAEGCEVPWGGGAELPGWTRALLGLRWGMVLDRLVAPAPGLPIHAALDQPYQQGPQSPWRGAKGFPCQLCTLVFLSFE